MIGQHLIIITYTERTQYCTNFAEVCLSVASYCLRLCSSMMAATCSKVYLRLTTSTTNASTLHHLTERDRVLIFVG